MSEKILTAREQAIKILQGGGSVIVNGQIYTLTGNTDTGAKSIKDLPEEEVFAAGDEKATAQAVESLKSQIADLQARYDAVTKASKVEAKKEEPAKVDKTEAKTEK